jgi:hypothetical protein
MTRDVLISIVTLVGLAAPAHATLTYCNSGCTTFNNNSGMTYTTFGATAVGLGDAMSSPITFVSGGLDGSGVYTDAGTGTVFTGFNGTTAEALILSGTSLAQTGTNGNGGNTNGRSIQIVLPANTYAFAMFVSSTSGFAGPWVELVSSPSDFNNSNGNYNMSISSSSDSQFFGIISNTAISSIFIGDLQASQSPVRIQSFEEGGPADASTPEVSTFLSIGSGLILMRFLRRRQQRRRPTKLLDPVFS